MARTMTEVHRKRKKTKVYERASSPELRSYHVVHGSHSPKEEEKGLNLWWIKLILQEIVL